MSEEPEYCKRCGTANAPGAESCANCGESLAPKEPWFGPKRVGYGYSPRAWQGWVILIVVIIIVFLVVRFVIR